MQAHRQVVVGVAAVTFEDVVAVARGGAGARIDPEAVAAMAASRARIEALAADPLRSTACPPGSARWPPDTFRRSVEPSCSAA